MMSNSLPRRWSLDHNPLSGLTLGRWWKLLCENRFDIDRAYAHRAALLTVLSLFNSFCHGIERLRYGRRLRGVSVRRDPVFILGHWRSGTTHLHNLLAVDPRLACPTTFQVVNPFSFLTTQRVLPRLFAPLLPRRRPMDNMEMSFEAPQEDELALALLCGLSVYLSLSFPRRAAHYDRYLTFDQVPEREVAVWKETFELLARKLSLGDGRRFVFKSPGHSARIRLLLELFPEARFVHLHRDPYTVFQSSRHYFHTAAWHANLQAHDPQDFDASILRHYDSLYGAYLAQRGLVPLGRLHELSFDSLHRDPIGELRQLYATLQLGPFDPVDAPVRVYLQSIAHYRPNDHPPLEEPERRRIAAAWGRYFTAFGYATGFEDAVSGGQLQRGCA